MQVPGLPGVYFRDMALELAGRSLSVFSASAVDLYAAAPVNSIPYWAVAWPAGLALARYLAARDLRGLRVLEVGCGVGVSGLGAAAAGAETLVTDNEVAALRVAMMNARRNRLAMRAVAADWRGFGVRPRFDLVIGSDVTYDGAAFPSLLNVLSDTLAAGGEVLVTDPGRITTEAFRQEAQSSGWHWSTEPLPREGSQAVFLHRLAPGPACQGVPPTDPLSRTMPQSSSRPA